MPTPPREPAWDITFTRLARAARPQIDAYMLHLVRRFQATGLRCDTQVVVTPRGLSSFLAVVGQRGLICIVDLTLIDGLAMGKGPYAAWSIRLLDACGDVVADDLINSAAGNLFGEAPQARPLTMWNVEQASTVVYVTAIAHFDLRQPVAPQT